MTVKLHLTFLQHHPLNTPSYILQIHLNLIVRRNQNSCITSSVALQRPDYDVMFPVCINELLVNRQVGFERWRHIIIYDSNYVLYFIMLLRRLRFINLLFLL